jgi:hypothetical protein
MREQVKDVLELLRLTLLGPNREELQRWGTAAELREEWLNGRQFFALKKSDGTVLQLTDFFDIHYFDDGAATIDGVTIERTAPDQFVVRAESEHQLIDLTGDM